MAHVDDSMGAIDETQDEILVVLAASIESSSKPVEISPEDASWADSCFTSDFSLDTLKAALLGSLDAPTNVSNANGEFNSDLIKEESEEETKDVDGHEADHERVMDAGDEDKETGLKSKQETDWRDEIFKVWDLEIDDELEDEENVLIKQLKKALLLSKYEGSSQFDVTEVDDLAADMGDLSLEPSID